jgi:GNAT superfamily N-acetyltransferase
MKDKVKIYLRNFDTIKEKKILIDQLRTLTLHPNSGMNKELDNLSRISKCRKTNAKIVLASYKREIIGWALISKEKSDFSFSLKYYDGYSPEYGTLVEIFVDPRFRKLGIGTKIIEFAKTKINDKICFCSWDKLSKSFFDNFKYLNFTDLSQYKG